MRRRQDPNRNVGAITARDGALTLELAGCTDRGPVRSENQDAWSIQPLEGTEVAALLVVADGMGGHEDGGAAARLAVTAVVGRVHEAADARAALPDAVAAANLAIREHGAALGILTGTTLVAAVVGKKRATITSVGDSRAYLVRNGAAIQLTRDHSWVADEVRAGRLGAEAAANHPRRNMLTRALTGDAVTVDLFDVGLAADDTLLLCSDGLWGVLDGPDIAAGLPPGTPLAEAVDGEVTAAIRAGATDNVTLVAARLVPPGGGPPPGAVTPPERVPGQP